LNYFRDSDPIPMTEILIENAQRLNVRADFLRGKTANRSALAVRMTKRKPSI
jgi:hypothetical protein